ncbi:MAG: response regulator [Clostridiales bacterium]|jgi:two-component system response regulator YesN|nr:response regulator [Clostridiales bacterium]
MPGLNGLEMIAKLRQTDTGVELIILSGCPDFTYAQQAIRERVRYYLLKPLDPEELISALSDIHTSRLKIAAGPARRV